MHEKYTTPAFVIKSGSSREADKILTLYTKDFGMISGLLSGVRNAFSKFKGFTEIGIKVSVTLVRGKSMWRITDISALLPYQLIIGNSTSFLRSLSLLRSLVHGEEKNEALFEVLEDIFTFLSKRPHSAQSLESLELVGSARILSALGYGRDIPKNISLYGTIHESDLLEASKHKSILVSTINLSLEESQLKESNWSSK